MNATFFVIGTAAYWNPDMVLAEYMAGHQIAVHTWRHQYLTTLSNEEVVAELGYTREIIKVGRNGNICGSSSPCTQDIIGVTPTTYRPPYGDVDDRIRAIAMAMGLETIVWTRDRKH